MKFLDRFKIDNITNKPLINSLNALVGEQTRNLVEANKIIKNTLNEVRNLKEEAGKWVSITDSGDKRELDDTAREKIRQKCIEIYYKTPEGKAIIKNLTNYIIGNGVNWTAQDENPAVQEFIDEFCSQPKVEFEKRQISIIKRTLRDGELFIHLLSDSKGKTYAMRFYSPGEITEIEKEPGDAETVIKYKRTWRDDKSKEQKEDIKADEIHHIRLEVDEDIDHGRPFLENVLTRIAQYEDWLDGRIKTNKAKSSIFLERIVEGSPSRVASVNAGFPGTTGGSFSEDEYSAQMPKYGTVVTHSKSVEWKWVEPKINADDCKEDGRQMRLSIAAGVQLPEFVLTSDSSNANYSSTTVAESPFVKGIEAHRLFFEHELGSLFAKIIKKGIDGGLLPSTSTETVMKESARKQINRLKAAGVADLKEQIAAFAKDDENFEERPVPTKTGVDFEWPSIITRNILEETQAVEMHRNMELCSRRTASMKFGYDPEEEKRIIQKEKEEEGPEEDAYAQMQGEIDKLRAEAEKKNDEIDTQESFPGHAGRPGQIGGSLPKGGGGSSGGGESGGGGTGSGIRAELTRKITTKVPKRMQEHEQAQQIINDHKASKKEITPMEAGAIQDSLHKFTGNDYADIRHAGMGRKGDFNSPEAFTKNLHRHDRIDSWVSLSTISENSTLYRGLQQKADVFNKANVGDTWKSKAISSWSGEPKVANGFAGDVMLVLKGGKARGRDISAFSTVPREREHLLSSKNNFKITGKEQMGKILVVTLEHGG